MKSFFSLLLILVFGITSGSIVPPQKNSSDRAVRFVIGSFIIDGSNDDLSRRLRSDFEGQLFDITDQCRGHLEFIPDAQEDALEYMKGIRERYQREFGLSGSSISIPKIGNYVLLVRVSNDNFGVIMNIGVFQKTAAGITYVAQGRAETDYALAKLYERKNRQDFVAKALDDAISTQRLREWIENEVGQTKLEDCFQNGEKEVSEGSNAPINRKVGEVDITLEGCSRVERDVVCNFTIKSNFKDRTVLLCGNGPYLCGMSYLYDDLSQKYIPINTVLINQGSYMGAEHKLIANIPVKGSITFGNISTRATKASLLEIVINIDKTKHKLEFRDIVLK